MSKKVIDYGAVEAARFGISRSPLWYEVQKKHLQLQPECVACKPGSVSGKEGLQVHHMFPFHYCILLGRPDLELDQRNLITLCEKEKSCTAQDHHLLIGHLDDFKSSNLKVEVDAEHTYYNMTEDQIKDNKAWQAEKVNKLTPFDKMTQKEKDDYVALMNKTFPKTNMTLPED